MDAALGSSAQQRERKRRGAVEMPQYAYFIYAGTHAGTMRPHRGPPAGRPKFIVSPAEGERVELIRTYDTLLEARVARAALIKTEEWIQETRIEIRRSRRWKTGEGRMITKTEGHALVETTVVP